MHFEDHDKVITLQHRIALSSCTNILDVEKRKQNVDIETNTEMTVDRTIKDFKML